MKPATEILLSAAFVLTEESNWWGRGRASKPNQVCAYTAIMMAGDELFPGPGRYAASDAAVAALRTVVHADVGHRSIFGWNDTRKRTHTEVVDALYRAAEITESA